MKFKFTHNGETRTIEDNAKKESPFCVIFLGRNGDESGLGVASRHARRDLAEKEIDRWYAGGSNKTVSLAVGELIK